jgi:hypothetical protein
LAPVDQSVRKQVNYYFSTIEALFRSALEAAQARRELPPDKDPDELAGFLLSGIWGLRVLAATAPDPARPQAVVEHILQQLEA